MDHDAEQRRSFRHPGATRAASGFIVAYRTGHPLHPHPGGNGTKGIDGELLPTESGTPLGIIKVVKWRDCFGFSYLVQQSFIETLQALIGAGKLDFVLVPHVEFRLGTGWRAVLAEVLPTWPETQVRTPRVRERVQVRVRLRGVGRCEEIGKQILGTRIVYRTIKQQLARGADG